MSRHSWHSRGMRTRAAATAILWMLAAPGCDGSGAAGDDGAGDDDGAPPVACGEQVERAGEGTYYDADGTGNCSFDPSPDDLMVAAINTIDYDGAAACGACARVDGPGGSVTVRIVDRCPGCAEGDVDLAPQAFERIAELSAGRVPITWRYVPCDVDGPLIYRFMEGSNPFWTAVQIRNHRHAIASVEAIQTGGGGGEWTPIARENYNYFVETDGLGEGPIGLRVTDVYGGAIEDLEVVPGDGTEFASASQLPACE
jgi:expansin (peptidoglycan-binding protein)